MIAALLDMWTVFRHSWPIWLFIAALTTYAVWACYTCEEYKRGQRREDEAAADREVLNDLDAYLERVYRADSHRRRTANSPANQPVVPYVKRDGGDAA